MEEILPVGIDIGCGNCKKNDTLGVDFLEFPGVDYVVDLTQEPLPFADNSVDYVYSAHFLEHIPHPEAIFSEISRVAKPGARIELWTPYVWSNDAFVLGHQTFHSEEIYLHLCVKHPTFWAKALTKRWILEEIQYVVAGTTLQELKAARIDLSFAIRHYHNIVSEFGVYIRLTDDFTAPTNPVTRTYSVLRNAERYVLKNTQIFGESQNPPDKVIRSFAQGGPLPTREGWLTKSKNTTSEGNQ